MVWIPDAALMTDAAANALLKTLEEPPAQTWFFLASREPARLLATLRSRCRLHHLAPPAESYAVSWLAREVTVSQEALLTALRLSAGSPGRRWPCWVPKAGPSVTRCVRHWRAAFLLATGTHY